MTRPRLLAPQLWTLLAVAPTALAVGCALFQNLDSSPYRLVDAGVDCGADAECPAFDLTCTDVCSSDQVCCVTVPAKGSPTKLCTASSACASTAGGGLSFAFCSTSADCTSASCVPQTCTIGELTVRINACGQVPTCSVP